MSTLVERIRQTVSEQALFGADDALVAAVSGGADSTAMALVLADLAPRLGARLIGLAHLNHQLRPAADADEAFCRSLAARIGVPFDGGRVDVAAAARERKTSIEDAARTVRYTFLSEVAAARGATRVAVGHTRDDQAETVILRLVRGAGPAGLASIHPRVGPVIRPLLDARRRDVEAYLAERGEAWREDESNQDRAFARNKVRHELLPWLTGEFGAGVVDVLARQAVVSRDDAEWFEMVATETAARLVIEDEAGVRLERAALGALHPAIGRRVVLAVLRRVSAAVPGRPDSGGALGRRSAGGGLEHRSLGGGAFVGFDHVDAVLALAAAGSGAADLPGQRIECRQGWLRFAPRGPDPGRQGRRRGRPVEPFQDRAEPIGVPAVSKSSGDRPGVVRRAGIGPEVVPGMEPKVEMEREPNGGPKCAGSVSLEGHAPKGGRG